MKFFSDSKKRNKRSTIFYRHGKPQSIAIISNKTTFSYSYDISDAGNACQLNQNIQNYLIPSEEEAVERNANLLKVIM